MKKEVISCYQAINLVIMFIIGSAIIINANEAAKQDVWLSLLIAMAAGLIIAFVYYRLLKLYPGQDLYDILYKVFGKYVGTFFGLLYIWYAFHLGSLVIRNFTEFIQIIEMPETPQYMIAIFITVTCVIAVKSGIEVIARWAVFIFPFVITILMFNLISGVRIMNFLHLLPILQHGYSTIFETAFGSFTFPFGEIVLFMTAFDAIKDAKSIKSAYLYGIIGGGLILILTSLRNILILGNNLIDKLNFPSYSAMRLVSVGDFLQHIEVLAAIVFTLDGIIKICICIYAVCKGITKIFHLPDYRNLSVSIGFCMVQLSIFIYTDVMQMFQWAYQVYGYYALPFQVIIPGVAWVIAEVKQWKAKKKEKIEAKTSFEKYAQTPEITQ